MWIANKICLFMALFFQKLLHNIICFWSKECLVMIVNLVFSPEKCVNLVFNQLTIVGEKIDEKQHLISDLQMKYQVITILLASAVISCNCILSKLCLLFVSLSI